MDGFEDEDQSGVNWKKKKNEILKAPYFSYFAFLLTSEPLTLLNLFYCIPYESKDS